MAVARLLREDGRFEEALPILRIALAGFESSCGVEDLETLKCANYLGNVIRDIGQDERWKWDLKEETMQQDVDESTSVHG